MKLDLGYGNPGFLQELWKEHNLLNQIQSKKLMPYKYAKKNDIKLEEEIFKLHIQNKNVKIDINTKIVVTVGAVQALQAAMYALKKIRSIDLLYIPKPYWMRFNDFAALTGLSIVDQPVNALSLVTSPNNPNGTDQSDLTTDIRDACYNWSHYTDDVKVFDDVVSVFSLSKLSGHSSTRIGWAVVQDEQIANLMQYYVNTITSGVSIEAQKNSAEILSILNDDVNFLIQAKDILKSRYDEVCEIITVRKLPIGIHSTQGMFLYVSCDSAIIEALNIECPNGLEFKDQNSDRYRLNLGCDIDTFNEFLKRIRKI